MAWRKEPRAITLDLDDTLWPVGPTLIAAEQTLTAWLADRAPATAALLTAERRSALRSLVLSEHPDRAHDFGFVRHELLRRALSEAGDDSGLADEAFTVFLAARQQVTMFDDVRPVLEHWSRRYRLVAVSNGNADIARVGLGDYFIGAISAHEIGYAKPDPRMFHEACRLAGVAPDEALHVGDDPHLDVIAARDAGLHSAWLRRQVFAHRHPADTCSPSSPPAFEDLHALEAALAALR